MKSTRSRSSGTRTAQDNAQLRRENGRLRKQIQRLNGAINSVTYTGFVEEEMEAEFEEKVGKKKLQQTPDNPNPCPQCSNPTGEVTLGKFIYLFCSSCDHRVRKES